MTSRLLNIINMVLLTIASISYGCILQQNPTPVYDTAICTCGSTKLSDGSNSFKCVGTGVRVYSYTCGGSTCPKVGSLDGVCDYTSNITTVLGARYPICTNTGPYADCNGSNGNCTITGWTDVFRSYNTCSCCVN